MLNNCMTRYTVIGALTVHNMHMVSCCLTLLLLLLSIIILLLLPQIACYNELLEI